LKAPRSAAESISVMTVPVRVELAKVKITNVVNRISALLAMAEHNALIVYSPMLSGQIPPSTAGHAFNVFQKAMHGYEIVQLCALWDKPDATLAHNSIPAVHALIDDEAVMYQLVENVRRFWPDLPVDDVLADYHRQTGDEEAGKALAALSQLRDEIPAILSSKLYVSVKNMRDRYLAHALDETRAEKRGQVAPMRYGDERELLQRTTEIIETLYLWVKGTHFDLAENRELQAKYALALWGRCRFDIAPRT
jgi:hypothetical protein